MVADSAHAVRTNKHLTTHMPTLVVWPWHPSLCLLCTACAGCCSHGFPALMYFKQFFRRQLNLQAAWQGHGCVPQASPRVTPFEPSLFSSVLPSSETRYCVWRNHVPLIIPLFCPFSTWLYYCSIKLSSCDLYTQAWLVPVLLRKQVSVAVPSWPTVATPRLCTNFSLEKQDSGGN